MLVSVILPTHNPHPGRLARTLAGLRAQTLPTSEWELVIVDSGSADPAWFRTLDLAWQPRARIAREAAPGLSQARRRGFAEAAGDLLVLVDDDNVLAPDYLAKAAGRFAAHPRLGALGGRSLPEYEAPPPDWIEEFNSLLALRDLGPDPIFADSLRAVGSDRDSYPPCAPIGAGMALRRPACAAWLSAREDGAPLPDRRGSDLTSSGDNDIVLCALRAGWGVAYFPDLTLTHVIPAGRMEPAYLARLNRAVARSWMQVLTLHGINPWPPLTRTGATLRKFKAWFWHRPWRSPVARIRWQGACGHFDGRVPGAPV